MVQEKEVPENKVSILLTVGDTVNPQWTIIGQMIYNSALSSQGTLLPEQKRNAHSLNTISNCSYLRHAQEAS